MATKKTTSKKAPVKKTTPKKRNSVTKTAKVRSFHIAPRDEPFWSFIFTTQSFYWVLIGASVIAVGLYVTTLQIRVNSLYDQLDVSSAQSQMNESKIEKINDSLEQ